ncbi:relaxase domain-containing protein [Dietzia sp. SL131]|uniref:MobF family relaxase n=1 Tax=Dietzia sp. SL131 TaxID=2995149 RepID=UPI00227C29C4|nr:MobF family relaxase [Dietzia sp. SL131]MCY1655691.1 relaxase domain-containing protein [Dietzia sp. SL131]
MTLHVLHAGDGYSYLTRQVAVADRLRERGQELTDYYTANGTPPGRWHGAGLEALSEISPVSGTVSEAQMKALFGEGRHPNTDAMLEAGADLKDTALGRKFPEFRNEIPLVEDYNATLREMAGEGHTIDKDVTADLWRTLADKHYRDKFGHQPATERELLSWAAAQRSNVRQPVAGMDLVFTPQKSVSALWALADTDTRQAIERIHRECVNDSLAWIEREAAFTRRGDRSEQQIDTHGLIVAQFDHYDTRAGDPNLHTHCAVSNKVLGADGRWSALDGASLHKHAVAASSRYNAAIVDRLRRELGVQFEARYPSRNKQPVWEIAGVDQALCRAFSSRRQMIEARRDELLAEYRDKHGRAPTQAVQFALLQQATLDTREGKQEARSLAELQSTWRRLAARHLGSEQAVDQMIAAALNPGAQAENTGAEVRELEAVDAEAARAIEAVSDTRVTWTHAHVRAAVEAQLTDVEFDSPAARAATVDEVVTHAMRRDSLALATPEIIETPTELRRESDGLSVLDRHGELLHTSEAMLAAERDVVDAARTPVPLFTTGEHLNETITALESDSGRTLNPGQRALAEHFCLSGQLVAAGVGPAGTGKTTSMQAVAKAWQATGRQVIALAPSAVAAETLGEEIGVKAYTVASLTYRWRGKLSYMGIGARTAEDLPVTIRPGAMLLLDEAAMASTKDVAALVEIARDRGAVVRMIGDPAQLDAVESGGLMRLVASETNAPELTDVVRFGDDTAQAAASIAIRSGEASALDFHASKGWIHGGGRDEMIPAVVDDHFADVEAGRDGIVLASTTEIVRELNTQIQNRHRDSGAAKTRRIVDLADELAAGRGDIVVTRSNNGSLRTKGGTRPGSRVQNGDRWRVEKVGKDGSLTVRHLRHRGRVTLDAQYVAECTELGYASTIHRAQGITVDVARTVVDEATNRRGLYVALTRGRHENHAYAVTEAPLDLDTEAPHLDPEVDDRLTTSRGVLEAALDRDEGHTTATEQLREALAAADDPDRMADRYNAARSHLIGDYSQHLLDGLPAALTTQLRDDPQLVALWRTTCQRHLDAGHDLTEAITAVRDRLLDTIDAEPDLPDYLPENTRRAIERDPQAMALIHQAMNDYIADGIDRTDALEAAVDDLMDGSLHRAAAPEAHSPTEPSPEDDPQPAPAAEKPKDAALPANGRDLIAAIDDYFADPADKENAEATANAQPAADKENAEATANAQPAAEQGAEPEQAEESPAPLGPLPPRHPGMNTELADYAAAVLVEHDRLLHGSAEEPADPDAADPFTASPAHDAEQARRGLFAGDPFAARGFDVADPFSSRPGDVEADRDEPARHETPAPGHEPAQGPEL